MREILFRGKRKDNGEWITGCLLKVTFRGETFHLIFGDDFSLIGDDVKSLSHALVDPSTVGQFTGLADKNGKKIFEGDIIKYHESFVMKSTGVVFFGENEWGGNTNVGFYVKWVIAELPDILRTDLGFWCHERDIEIIGNIHDNPELLEEAK